MKQYLFFDLDNTVSRSRSTITTEMRDWLTSAPQQIVIVSGATVEQITFQMDGVICFKLGQNGNHAVDPEGNTLWKQELKERQKQVIMNHIAMMPRDWEVHNEADLVQDRGCQVSYSLLGHNEVLELKEAFDPEGIKRSTLLAAHPFADPTVQVRVGGTTCLDYTALGKNKGHFVEKLIPLLGWQKSECIYYGDMLFPGGNDESVVGVIETQAVEDPADTLRYLIASAEAAAKNTNYKNPNIFQEYLHVTKS